MSRRGRINTKYFSNLEKKRYETKTINRLIKTNIDITKLKGVLIETMQYYKTLYEKVNRFET